MEDFYKLTEVYSSEHTSLISKEFTRLDGQHYLEHAGATLYSEKQIQNVFSDLNNNLLSNPHAKNLSSTITEDAIDVVRFQILSHFKTNPEEYSVIFTSGATQSLKIVGECFDYKKFDDENGIFVYLQDNHTSVLGIRTYCQSSRCLSINEAFKTLNNPIKTRGKSKSNSLFAYPAQSNFSGTKYPLSWIEDVRQGALNQIPEIDCQNWFVLLDAASYVSTNQLDLSIHKPDFVAISFYKMFGYPTGLGALLVKKESKNLLRKKYYGGGAVHMAQVFEQTVVFRDVLHARFEDGSLPFLDIIALRHGFETISRLKLNFNLISEHTFYLAQYVYRNLLCLHHSNGAPVAILYHNGHFENLINQGGIINFNLMRASGEYIGYSEVLHISNLYKIHLRTGCFCNQGACQYFLGLSTDDVRRNFELGHVCGDQHDLVDGRPTGSVRISFGYMSTKADADKFLEMIENCFVTKPVIKKNPQSLESDGKKYCRDFSLLKPSIKKQLERNGEKCNVESKYTNKSITSCHYSRGILENIFLFPVKSCGAFSVPKKWPLTTTGLKYDREWMVINSSGVCVTQKHNKKLCLIKPIIDLEKQTLTLYYPEHPKIILPLNPNLHVKNAASLCNSKVCGDKIQGWDCGNEVADWLCNILQCPGLRLVKQCSQDEEVCGRTTTESGNLHLSLANKAQYLLVNKRSVEWLRERIPEENEFRENLDLTVHRFRPNFVVKFDDPFVENDCVEFEFNDIKFKTGGKCTRCQMICIDQMTGKASKEPLQTLSREFKGKISFGVYLNRLNGNNEDVWVAIGDKINGRSEE